MMASTAPWALSLLHTGMRSGMCLLPIPQSPCPGLQGPADPALAIPGELPEPGSWGLKGKVQL